MKRIFIGMQNNVDPQDPKTKDRGFDISLDSLFTSAFLLMSMNHKYNNFEDVCSMKERKEIEICFVPRTWRGKEFVFRKFNLPAFKEGHDLAVGISRRDIGLHYHSNTNGKYRSLFEKIVSQRLGKDHKALDELYCLFKLLDENSTEAFDPGSCIHLMQSIMALDTEYEELKKRHHFNQTTIYSDVLAVNKTILLEAFKLLDQMIGGIINENGLPLRSRQKKRKAMQAKKQKKQLKQVVQAA